MAGQGREDLDHEIVAFQSRLEELLATHALFGEGDTNSAAAYLELETAAEELRVAHEELTTRGEELSQRQASADQDRQVLRAVFRKLPLGVVLLDRDGRIRRVNERATDVLGLSADYLSGKPFPVLVDLPARAAFRSELAAVTRGQGHRIISTALLHGGEPLPTRIVASIVPVPADPRPLIAAVLLPRHGAVALDVRQEASTVEDSALVRSATRRMDLLTGVTGVLLGEQGRTEASALQGVASRLRAEFSDWVLIDLVRGGELSRAVVCGPTDPDSAAAARALERAPVGRAPLPRSVIEGTGVVLEPHLEDAGVLGHDDRELPLVSMMGAHSLLSVRIEVEGASVGAITALRTRGSMPFTLFEQATLQDIVRLVAPVLASARDNTRQIAVGAALQATRRPRQLPRSPALDVAWTHRTARPDVEAGAGFLDAYPSKDGWGAALGETDGPGDQAAAIISMVWSWVRLLGVSGDDPRMILTRANEAMRALRDTDRVVHLVAAALHIDGPVLHCQLVSAGHRSSTTLRADGRVQRTDGGGQPLNAVDEATLHSDVSELHPGDTLLLYSTGLLKARNAAGETFDAVALGNVLSRVSGRSAQYIVDSVIDALTDFVDAAGLETDIAILAVRFTG